MLDLALVVATYICFRLVETLATLSTRYASKQVQIGVGIFASLALLICGFEWLGILLQVMSALTKTAVAP
jgi:hypothetical protein